MSSTDLHLLKSDKIINTHNKIINNYLLLSLLAIVIKVYLNSITY